MTKLNFESFDLKIDGIAFNIDTQDFDTIQMIANYLAERFNCKTRFIDKKQNTKTKLVDLQESWCTAEFFINEVEYWSGTILRFSGQNAAIFYKTYKYLNQQHYDISIFNINFMSLGRLDLKYDRMMTSADPSLIHFLEKTKHRQPPNVKTKLNLRKQSLKIWTRKNSPKHYRIYLRNNGKKLRFELELKREKAKAYQHSFFRQDFDEFEKSYLQTFFEQTSKIFDFDNLYLDWFENNFRLVRKSDLLITESLSTTYLTLETIHEYQRSVDFYRFIQLLTFLETLESESVSLAYGEVTYRSHKFRLSQFLEFTGYQKTNRYQLQKLKNFIISLNTIPPFNSYFYEDHYRGVNFFSLVDLKKEKNTWYVILVSCKEVTDLLYPLPFRLPQAFLTYDNKYALHAQLFLLQTYTQKTIKKRLYTQEFFSKLSLGNNAYPQVKKNILLLFDQLVQSKLIKSNFEVTIKNGQIKTVQQLTTNIISRSKWIDFDENIGL